MYKNRVPLLCDTLSVLFILLVATIIDCECTTIKKTNDDTYSIYGYVGVRDDYGSFYKGNFNATATVTEKWLRSRC